MDFEDSSRSTPRKRLSICPFQSSWLRYIHHKCPTVCQPYHKTSRILASLCNSLQNPQSISYWASHWDFLLRKSHQYCISNPKLYFKYSSKFCLHQHHMFPCSYFSALARTFSPLPQVYQAQSALSFFVELFYLWLSLYLLIQQHFIDCWGRSFDSYCCCSDHHWVCLRYLNLVVESFGYSNLI
jgi:hypothetical protein